MELYPLKFHPIYKDRIWGGTRLSTCLGKDIRSDTTGESWEISAVEGDVSVVAHGAFKGKTLPELAERYQEQLLGKRVFQRFGTSFPILIKFIDARQDLSIQLHPDDVLAQKRHNASGKTEMWYIIKADAEARLIIGFNKAMDTTTYQQHLKNNTLETILHYEPVREGDAFFIRPGKVHAIGGGILLAEIQQTSDITYRIFDFNRKDSSGKLRELHTELALEAIDYSCKDDFRLSYSKEENVPGEMVHCPYFITNYLHLKGRLKRNFTRRDSFTIYMCVDGALTLTTGKVKEKLKKGETLLIPASLKAAEIQAEEAKLLEIYL